MTAQTDMDVNGRPARAHVAGQTDTRAVDLPQHRLAEQPARLAEHWEPHCGRMPAPGPNEWRHGDEPIHRPDHYPRAAAR